MWSLHYNDGSMKRASFVQMHGTGTPLGDPIEMGAAAAVLLTGARLSASNPLALASSKSIVGHAEPAAGASTFAIFYPAVCAIKRQRL